MLGNDRAEVDHGISSFVSADEDATQHRVVPNVALQSEIRKPFLNGWRTKIPEYATLSIQAEEVNIMAITAEELLQGETYDAYCKPLGTEVGEGQLQLDLDRGGLLCRESSLQKCVELHCRLPNGSPFTLGLLSKARGTLRG